MSYKLPVPHYICWVQSRGCARLVKVIPARDAADAKVQCEVLIAARMLDPTPNDPFTLVEILPYEIESGVPSLTIDPNELRW